MAVTKVADRQVTESIDLTTEVSGVLPVANGGTNSSTLTLNNVLLGNGTGALQVVAPGSSGNVLTSNGTTWASSAPTGGGSGIVRNIATVVTTVTLSATANTDYVVFIGASGVVTLPTAVGNTNMYTLKNVDTTNKTISTTSSQTIDGSTTVTLTPNTSIDVISDNSNWRIV